MKKLKPIYAVLLTLTLLYSFSSEPPIPGRTGAPGESNCTSCHTPGNTNFMGNVSINGLPAIIVANTTYDLSVITKISNGSPIRAGFQMVILDEENNNVGMFGNVGDEASLQNANGKTYFGHDPAAPFNEVDSVKWTVEWTAPESLNSDSIKIYLNSIIGSGNNGNSNDLMVSSQPTFSFSEMPVLPLVLATESSDVSCFGANDGTATVNATGGTGTISYQWSTDATTQTIADLSEGTYSVTATDEVGSTAIISANINQPDEITVSLSGDQYVGCDGNDTLEIAGVATEGTDITYQWTSTDGVIIGDATALTTAVVGGGTYTLTATQSNSNCIASASMKVISVSPPLVDAGPSIEINCANKDVILAGTGSSGPNITIKWTTEDGRLIAGINSKRPRVDKVGTYTLTLTDIVTGCSSSSSVLVTQGEIVDLFVASGDAEQLTCARTSITLNAAATEGEDITYEWTTENGNIISGINTLTPVIDAPGRYILTIRDTIKECSKSSSLNISEDTSNPIVDAGTNHKLSCNSTSLSLNGSSTGFHLRYSWTTMDGRILNGDNTLTPSVDKTGTYTLTVLDTLSGCSASANVLVLPDDDLPIVDVGTTLQLDCNTDTLTLMGSGSVGDNFTALWSTEDGHLIGDLNSFSPMVNMSGDYTLTISDNELGCSNSATITVIENKVTPIVELANTEQFLCENTTLIVDALAPVGNDFIFSWTTEDGSILSEADVLKPEIDQAGIYELLVTNKVNGCSSTNSLKVTMVSSPIIGEEIVNGVPTITVLGGIAPYDYNWSIDSISIEDFATLSPGTYILTVSDANGCKDIATFSVTMSTGISELEESIQSMQVYPNPSQEYFSIKVDFNEKEIGEVFIMNKVGQGIWRQKFDQKNLDVKVPVNNWSAGVYYMLLQTAKGMKAEELIVIH